MGSTPTWRAKYRLMKGLMMDKYTLTRIGCYLSLFMQAYCACTLPILFVSLMNLYGLNYLDLGIMIFLLYSIQILVDVIVAPLIERFSYRFFCLLTPITLILGVILFVMSPIIIPDNVRILFYIGICLISSSAGLIEVLVSPIIESLPSKNKEKSMSLLHSFYGIGVIFVVLFTSLAIVKFNDQMWQYIMLAFLFIPLIIFILFLKAKFIILTKKENQSHISYLKDFHFYIFLFAIMIGAAMEIIMSQFLSTFFVKTLNFPKIIGDMLGVISFAVTFTIGRLLFGLFGEKVNLSKILILGSIISFFSYTILILIDIEWIVIVSCFLCGFGVSLMWPGNLSLGAKFYKNPSPNYFGLMSAFGDLGAALFPFVIGVITNAFFSQSPFGLKFAFLIGSIISLISILLEIYIYILLKQKNKKGE